MKGLLDRYTARKRKQQVISSKFDPAQAVGCSLPVVEGGSEAQAIVIPGSPEIGETDQTEPTGVARTESKEVDPAPSALQVIHPSDEGRPGRSKFMRFRLPRPPLSEQIITNSYASPSEQEPPRVEVSTPGVDEVKFILHPWEPFHLGEAATDRMNNLYPHMLRMAVAARAWVLVKTTR